MMDYLECRQQGRVKYLYTRSDGTRIAEKPPCCCRVFIESKNINQKATFKGIKVLPRDEMFYNEFMKKIKETPPQNLNIYEEAFFVSQDVDKLLKEIAEKRNES